MIPIEIRRRAHELLKAGHRMRDIADRLDVAYSVVYKVKERGTPYYTHEQRQRLRPSKAKALAIASARMARYQPSTHLADPDNPPFDDDLHEQTDWIPDPDGLGEYMPSPSRTARLAAIFRCSGVPKLMHSAYGRVNLGWGDPPEQPTKARYETMFDRIKKLGLILELLQTTDRKELMDFPDWTDADDVIRWIRALGGPIGWIISRTNNDLDDKIFDIVTTHDMDAILLLTNVNDPQDVKEGLIALLELADKLSELTEFTTADDVAVDMLLSLVKSPFFARLYPLISRYFAPGEMAVGELDNDLQRIVNEYLAETAPVSGDDDKAEFDPITIITGINMAIAAIKMFREWREAHPDWMPGDNLRAWIDSRREGRSK